MSIRWWSQPFAPEGSAAAEGIVKQLGRPSHDPLTVLVREAAQNSWDARLPEGALDFHVNVRVLHDGVGAWRSTLLPGPTSESGLALADSLQPDCIVLVISDRGTVGLGGPLRAGGRPPEGSKSDFVQFLRNVGEPSDHKFGGGTYGFGKGILYQLSQVGAIVVDTKIPGDCPSDRRLMGAALSHSWYFGDRRFTGRHWWGNVAHDDVPDPILGPQADAYAKDLGLPGFADGSTGTDIAIIAADLGVTGSDLETGSRSPQEAAMFIASSILWNLWPKMVPDERGRHIRFSVGVNGSSVPVPDPETINELAPFVEALQELRAGKGAQYSRTVPPKRAGALALALGAGGSSDRLLVQAAKPFEGTSRHVARMRVAELVVDYVAGPPHPDSRLAYGAVFKASEDADALFAASEPPTHDDWVAKGLSGSARGTVLGARAFIQRQLDEKLGLTPQAGGSDGQGLGQLSVLLAGIIPARFHGGAGQEVREDGPVESWKMAPEERSSTLGASATLGGTSTTDRPTGEGDHASAGARRGGKPRLVGAPSIAIEDGRPLLVATVRIPGADISRAVSAEVEVVLEGGGRENERPLGAAIPEIIEWRSATGEVVPGKTVSLPAGEEADWRIFATHVPDAVVRFTITEVRPHAS